MLTFQQVSHKLNLIIKRKEIFHFEMLAEHLYNGKTSLYQKLRTKWQREVGREQQYINEKVKVILAMANRKITTSGII